MKLLRLVVWILSGLLSLTGLVAKGQSSKLIADPAFVYASTIHYADFQASDIQASSTSIELAGFRLVDGDGLSDDSDVLPTSITAISLKISTNGLAGASFIRKLALYNDAGIELQEVDFFNVVQGTVTFSGLSITAPDFGTSGLRVRASFNNIQVPDNAILQVVVTGIVVGPGSSFSPGTSITGGTLVGNTVTGAVPTPGNKNRIDVIATKLDFTTQPDSFAGIFTPFNGGVVQARDQYNNTDTDFNLAADVYATVPVSGSFVFANGQVNLNGLIFETPGDGTLSVVAGGLSTSINNIVNGWPNISVSSSHVDVLHIMGSYAPQGIVTTTNLVGGSANKVIFGVTFQSLYAVLDRPAVNKFTISFNNPIAGVLDNIRILESATNSFVHQNTVDVTLPAINASVHVYDRAVEVVFPAPRVIDTAPDGITYFMMVDIDPNTDGNTPLVQPSVVDGGFGSLTDGGIVTSVGSASASVFGQSYTFSRIQVPTLIESYPRSGQTNVDQMQPAISLTFSEPVWSLDGQITLKDLTQQSAPVVLTSTNGIFDLQNNVLGNQTLEFLIPVGVLVPDHVYAIGIAPGDLPARKGIMNLSFNYFGGISNPGELYFKVGGKRPPQLLGTNTLIPAVEPYFNFVSPRSAMLAATFDRHGTAYYLITNPGATEPTSLQIKGLTPYSGLVAIGSFSITHVTPLMEFALVTPQTPFVPGQHYDVWMCTESDDLPVPVFTAYPIGADHSAVAPGRGPSMRTGLVPPFPATSQPYGNVPEILLCVRGGQIVSMPISIIETAQNQFQTNGAETINLKLPAGFKFDVTMNGLVPKFGRLQLQGADFLGTGALQFIGDDVVQIIFDCPSASSLDQISVSGLRIVTDGTVPPTGLITRLGGSGILSIPDHQVIANLRTFEPRPLAIDNSYSLAAWPDFSPVSQIPDNGPTRIELTPVAPPRYSLFLLDDFGPSWFKGPGVSGNVLDLSAVPLGGSVVVTMTHSDNNGCTSDTPITFTRYDHTKVLRFSDGPSPAGSPLAFSSWCASNDKFVTNSSPNRPTYGRSGHVRYVDFQNDPDLYLLHLSANLPPGSGNQIMNGPYWESVARSLIQTTGSHIIGPYAFNDYVLDDAVFADASYLTSGALIDPYQNFRKEVQTYGGRTLTFYEGGSLGQIELSAEYRSRAYLYEQILRKTQIEILLPGAPVIATQTAPASIDVNDPINPPDGLNNPGTLVFCEGTDFIELDAYPKPVGGVSVGFFTLFDATTNTILRPNAFAFVDDLAGKAILRPRLLQNNYNDIRVVYTYKYKEVSCSADSYQMIRISPNPIANFTAITAANPHVSGSGSYCVGIPIQFDASGSSIAPSAVQQNAISAYRWDFGDNSTSAAVSLPHTYSFSNTFPVQLEVISNWGCSSFPLLRGILVDEVPDLSIKASGVSVADPVAFQIALSPSNTVTSWDVDFGDGSTVHSDYLVSPGYVPPSIVTHSYVLPGVYIVDVKVSTLSGCINSTSLKNSLDGMTAAENNRARSVFMLPAATADDSQPYLQNFEAGNGGWISLGSSASWEWGTPTSSKFSLTKDLVTNGQRTNMWVTGLAGPYNTEEKSYLYGPVIDLTSVTVPTVAFNHSRFLQPDDAFALQISSDNYPISDPLKAWITVGSDVGGIFWYSSHQALSQPGEQSTPSFGWTGNQAWNRSAWDLTDLLKSPGINKKRVAFRLAFRSIAPSVADGIAIDNFRVGSDNVQPAVAVTKSILKLNVSKNDTIRFLFTDDVALGKMTFTFKNISAPAWTTLDLGKGIPSMPPGIAAFSTLVKGVNKEVAIVLDHTAYDSQGLKYYLTAGDLFTVTDPSLCIGCYRYTVSDTTTLRFQSSTVSVPGGSAPERPLLGDNYPNPVDTDTMIPFDLPGINDIFDVRLTIIDMNGRPLKELVNGKKESGHHDVKLAKVGDNGDLSPGMYLYRLSVQSSDVAVVVVKKMVIN